MRDALCVEYPDNADDWFPSGREASAAVKRARAVCQRCAVQRECVAYALDNELVDGVWGGTTPRDRRQLRARGILGRHILEYGMHANEGRRSEAHAAWLAEWLALPTFDDEDYIAS